MISDITKSHYIDVSTKSYCANPLCKTAFSFHVRPHHCRRYVPFNNISYLQYVQAWANSVDLDQTTQNTASDQDLHCLHLIQEFLGNTVVIKKQPDTPFLEIWPIQKIQVEQSIRHKWVNTDTAPRTGLTAETTCWCSYAVHISFSQFDVNTIS